jgi:glyoxylase-like metal-dependent hydrolase (beta-lactamase superfamily II)
VIELYNTLGEVLEKARQGLGIDAAALNRIADLSPPQRRAISSGLPDPATAHKLAESLELDPEALASFSHDRTSPALPAAVERLELPFEDETVNAWSIRHRDGLLLIDTGLRPAELASVLPNGSPIDLLVTHNHRDHVGGLPALASRLRSSRAPEALGAATPTHPGDSFKIGELRITVFDLSGHHPRAVGYGIDGLGPPVVAVGDAIFARSIGGCPDPHAYRLARRTLVAALRDAAPETLLLPGHGAATRLEQERRENPFLAHWLNAAADAP